MNFVKVLALLRTTLVAPQSLNALGDSLCWEQAEGEHRWWVLQPFHPAVPAKLSMLPWALQPPSLPLAGLYLLTGGVGGE